MVTRFPLLFITAILLSYPLLGMFDEKTPLYHHTINNLIEYGVKNELISENEAQKIKKLDQQTVEQALSEKFKKDLFAFINLNKKTYKTIIKLNEKDLEKFGKLAEKLLPALKNIEIKQEKKEIIEIKNINLSPEDIIIFPPKRESTREKLEKFLINKNLTVKIPKKSESISPKEEEISSPKEELTKEDYTVSYNPNFTLIPDYFAKKLKVYSPDIRISPNTLKKPFIIKPVQKENIIQENKKEDITKKILKNNNGFDKKPSKKEKEVIIGYGYNPESYRWIEPYEQEIDFLLEKKKLPIKKSTE